MPLKRFYLSDIPQEAAIIEGKELHHMKNVLRLTEGEEIELFDGKGCLAMGVIKEYRKEKCEVAIREVTHTQKKPYLISLLQGITRSTRLDWLLEKVVEIGLDEILLYPSDRSLRKELLNLDRLMSLMISAAKQSGELFLPSLTLLKQGDLSSFPPYEMVFLDPRAKAPLKDVLSPLLPSQKVLLCIGPESGWSPDEEAWAQNPSLKVQKALLFQGVLRSETAAIASLAIARHLRQPTPNIEPQYPV